jgi:hypothetical protein
MMKLPFSSAGPLLMMKMRAGPTSPPGVEAGDRRLGVGPLVAVDDLAPLAAAEEDRGRHGLRVM